MNAGKIFFGKTPIDRILTTDTDQVINGNVTIHGNISVSNCLEIDHLITNNSVFEVDLNGLLDDCYLDVSNDDSIVVTTKKWFQNITIEELIVESDFWQMGEPTSVIAKRVNELNNGLHIQGPITFSSHFDIKNLTVTDSINDIPSSIFGQHWLLYEGKQVRVFTFFSIDHKNHQICIQIQSIYFRRYFQRHKISRMLHSTIIFNCLGLSTAMI